VLENIWVREEEIIDIISILDNSKARLFLCKWLKMLLNTILSNILLTQDNNETGL
jgi:hypothetical protein